MYGKHTKRMTGLKKLAAVQEWLVSGMVDERYGDTPRPEVLRLDGLVDGCS